MTTLALLLGIVVDLNVCYSQWCVAAKVATDVKIQMGSRPIQSDNSVTLFICVLIYVHLF